MDLKSLLLTQGVIVATCLSTFVGAPELAPEPAASSPSPSSSSPSLCSRPLLTTLWGAAFAFFSLTADAWPAAKAGASVFGDASSSRRLLNFLLFAPVAPWHGIFLVLGQMFKTIRFRQILSPRFTHPELASDAMSCIKLWRVMNKILFKLLGINQARGILKNIRIVANTYIVLGMNDSNTLPDTHIDTENSPVREDNMADALTLGQKTAGNSCLMVLNDAGKLALLECSVLPNYKQLRFVDGRSGIATLIIAFQAIGYVASIVCRAILHLPVSPIETIGLAFSMVVIVHSVVHSVGAICENPLVMYLNPEQQQEILDECQATRWNDVDDEICRKEAIVVMVVVGSLVVAFTIVVGWPVLTHSSLGCSMFRKACRKIQSENWRRENFTWDVLGLSLFLLSLCFQLYIHVIFAEYYISPWTVLEEITMFSFLIPLLTFLGIGICIVTSILNWHQCDSRTHSLIHVVPFLG
ncbi:unnamed protein product [Sphagnum jensenii]|uniref:Uncharacterized protein n=2 Tax=Sphagnum jensenii TaxID=128206 RepID=A0ABP1A422_9BRYO